MSRTVLPRALALPKWTEHPGRLLLLALSLSLLTGCESASLLDAQDDSLSSAGSFTSFTSQEHNSDGDGHIDNDLKMALRAAAPNGDIKFFELPASNRLHKIPQDPQNPLTDAKVELGRLLFHDTGLMVNNVRPVGRFSASCASCHHAAAGFQAGIRQGIGEGGEGFGLAGEARTTRPQYDDSELDVQPIRTPTAMNGAFQAVMLWNGQFGATGPNAGTESQWTSGTPKETNFLGYEGLETQAIAGLKVHRMSDIDLTLAATDPTYKSLFAEAFPGQPIDRERAGLAIAAFERTLLATEAPFQRWLQGDRNALSAQEKEGALLFFGKAECSTCHTGPALNSMTFYALGMGDLEGTDVVSPSPERLGRGGFTGVSDDLYKFKTPQLYNLIDSPFYGHGGTFRSVREVVEYKNAAIPENGLVPQSQLAGAFQPLGLTSEEVDAIVAFLERGLYDPALQRYVPRAVPSGNCIPVNDPKARQDLDCNNSEPSI